MPNPIYKFPREAFEGSRVPRVSYSINVLDLVTVEHDQPDDCVQLLIRGMVKHQTVEVASREWAARITWGIEALWAECTEILPARPTRSPWIPGGDLSRG